MSNLEKALERLVDAATTTVTAKFTDEREIPVLVAAISDARDVLARGPARRFANLTSEETIGRVADTIAAYFGSDASGPHERDSNLWELAEAVLRAIEEDT